MEKKLRKHQNLLVEAGAGVILFAVWSVTRVNLFLALSDLSVNDVYDVADELGLNGTFFLAFMIFVFASILLCQLSIRLYIGLSATAEGKGRTKGWAYLVMAAVLLVTDAQLNWEAFGVERILAGEAITLHLLVGIFMELASMYILLELLISGICVKTLRKKMKE